MLLNSNANIEKIRKHNRIYSEGQEARMLRARAKKNKLTRRDYERMAEARMQDYPMAA